MNRAQMSVDIGSRKRESSKAPEQNYSIDQVAARLCVHRSSIERLLFGGKLGYWQIGRRRIISETHYGEYLALIERESTVDRMY